MLKVVFFSGHCPLVYFAHLYQQVGFVHCEPCNLLLTPIICCAHRHILCAHLTHCINCVPTPRPLHILCGHTPPTACNVCPPSHSIFVYDTTLCIFVLPTPPIAYFVCPSQSLHILCARPNHCIFYVPTPIIAYFVCPPQSLHILCALPNHCRFCAPTQLIIHTILCEPTPPLAYCIVCEHQETRTLRRTTGLPVRYRDFLRDFPTLVQHQLVIRFLSYSNLFIYKYCM